MGSNLDSLQTWQTATLGHTFTNVLQIGTINKWRNWIRLQNNKCNLICLRRSLLWMLFSFLFFLIISSTPAFFHSFLTTDDPNMITFTVCKMRACYLNWWLHLILWLIRPGSESLTFWLPWWHLPAHPHIIYTLREGHALCVTLWANDAPCVICQLKCLFLLHRHACYAISHHLIWQVEQNMVIWFGLCTSKRGSKLHPIKCALTYESGSY